MSEVLEIGKEEQGLSKLSGYQYLMEIKGIFGAF